MRKEQGDDVIIPTHADGLESSGTLVWDEKTGQYEVQKPEVRSSASDNLDVKIIIGTQIVFAIIMIPLVVALILHWTGH